jgi:hypothetical protein
MRIFSFITVRVFACTLCLAASGDDFCLPNYAVFDHPADAPEDDPNEDFVSVETGTAIEKSLAPGGAASVFSNDLITLQSDAPKQLPTNPSTLNQFVSHVLGSARLRC